MGYPGGGRPGGEMLVVAAAVARMTADVIGNSHSVGCSELAVAFGYLGPAGVFVLYYTY